MFNSILTCGFLFYQASDILSIIGFQTCIQLIAKSLEAFTIHPEIIALILLLTISDNGVSINDEVLESIFLPFYSTKTNSSGIGISLSKQIMMLHHARLEVVTGLKTGATFITVF
jgi:signal transduction histidine kinase